MSCDFKSFVWLIDWLIDFERGSASGGEAQTEGERGCEAGSALTGWQQGTECGAQTHEPQDHDLSWSETLNRLSHIGAPRFKSFVLSFSVSTWAKYSFLLTNLSFWPLLPSVSSIPKFISLMPALIPFPSLNKGPYHLFHRENIKHIHLSYQKLSALPTMFFCSLRGTCIYSCSRLII